MLYPNSDLSEIHKSHMSRCLIKWSVIACSVQASSDICMRCRSYTDPSHLPVSLVYSVLSAPRTALRWAVWSYCCFKAAGHKDKAHPSFGILSQ